MKVSVFTVAILSSSLLAACVSSPIQTEPEQTPDKPSVIDMVQRALPTQAANAMHSAHYAHVYIDTSAKSAQSLQTITLADAIASEVLASSDLQVKPLEKIDTKALQWVVLGKGYSTPTPLEGVGGTGIKGGTFAEVNFAINDSEILNRDPIAELVNKFSRVSGVFHVVGYADETGIEAKNLTLSEDRANAVVLALTAAGVHKTRIVHSGAGISRVYPELAANRRASVSFKVDE